MLTEEIRKSLITAQKCEITEHIIYKKLSEATNDSHNKKVLSDISRDELRHYSFWKQFTGCEEKPYWLKVWAYYFVSRILGLTFGIKLMEMGEGQAQITYKDIAGSIPGAHFNELGKKISIQTDDFNS